MIREFLKYLASLINVSDSTTDALAEQLQKNSSPFKIYISDEAEIKFYRSVIGTHFQSVSHIHQDANPTRKISLS